MLDEGRHFFGKETVRHLLELMADTANLSSREVVNMLKESVEEHRCGAIPNDDLTLMCLKILAI